MYVWQMYIQGYVVMGRTWLEFMDIMKWISRQVPEDKKLVCYVHNLSYEFCYISGIYKFCNDDVFAVDKRKVLKCTMLGNIEYRCSYLLSNMSLDAYTKKMKVKNVKLTGRFNYDKIRLSTTKLSRNELRYCINDVVGLHQAIKAEMELENDNVSTIPLTSTGYIRRDARAAMYKYKHSLIDKIYPTLPIYRLLREAFRGGNTHANRYYAGAVLRKLKSIDISSSYPTVMITCKFPMTKFRNIGCIEQSEMEDYISKGKAVLMKVVLSNVTLKDELNGAPYLSLDKCRGVVGEIPDNGRILSADMLETTITDIDWGIIKEQYDFDKCIVKECAIAEYGELPQEFKDVLIKYFKVKTKLKGDDAQSLYYDKSKNKLNAGYGMMAQNPVKTPILYDGGEWNDGTDEEMDLLNEYQKHAFLVYQWGVWVTAYARRRLQDGINMAGHRFVYCDTDSVKYIDNGTELSGLAEFNTQRMIEAEAHGCYGEDAQGILHYMGVYEDDAKYGRFITFGAKKYIYTDKKGLHTTIAGVNKKRGAQELIDAGGFKAVKLGYIFRKGGGTDVTYNDDTYGWYNIDDTHRVYITRNMWIRPGEYTLNVTKDYGALLLKCKNVSDHLLANY